MSLRFLSSLTTSTSLYGNSGQLDPRYTNHVLLRNVLLFSVVCALLTPEKHSLLTSAISWATVALVCMLYKSRRNSMDNTTATWRAGAATGHGADKKARRKITLLVGCILLSGISERASEQGWAERESWWAKAALPPTITFLRTYVFGEPGILETSTRPSRKVIFLITIVSFFTLLPKYVSTTSYALGLCNIAITSFAYVLFEDVTPAVMERGDVGQTAIEFDVVIAGGLSTIAVSCTVGFIIAGIFYDSKIMENGVALQSVWIQAILAGFVGGAKWLLVPLLVSRFSATSAGSVDLSSALFAGLLYPLPSFTHIVGTLAALGGMLWTYLPLITKEQYSMVSKIGSKIRFGPARLVAVFLILILISSLFIFQPGSRAAPKSGPKPAPEVENPKIHPITQLVDAAYNGYEEMKSRQSTTLEAAVKTYKKRYNMNPPPNFDKWYEFAVAKRSRLIDEYDIIHHSLRPFWGIPPHIIRERAREALNADAKEAGFLRLSIRDGDVLEANGGPTWMVDAAQGMVKDFKRFLPDMDLPLNTHDEPRVVVPHDELALMVQKGVDQKMKTSVTNQFSEFASELKGKIPYKNETRFNSYAQQHIWGPARLSCPLNTPARDIGQEQAADATDKYMLPPLGFIRNRTASTDVCLQPSLKDRLAFLERPNVFKVAHSLFPIFSQSKLSNFNDIVYPSPWYWAWKVEYDAAKDVDWSNKKDQMFWRGSTTGGFSTNGGWKKHHRQRMVMVINGNDTCQILEHPFTAQKWGAVEKKREDYRNMFDVGFSHIGQCDETDCAEQLRFFGMKEASDPHEMWKWKYLIDIDGNAFSGRFYAFLHSQSAVFKVSLFREWHEDWLVPWVHYVPISLQMDEIVEVMRYFMNEKDGQEEIKRIADEGRKWAQRVLRKEDFEVWFFRLLLEYGRVIDDNRENIGYIP